MDLSQIVNNHMDEHAPSAIGGGFGVAPGQALAGAAPQTMAGVPTSGGISTGQPTAPNSPGVAGLDAAKAAGASLMAHPGGTGAAAAFSAPPLPAPLPVMATPPPMLQTLPGAAPMAAMSDRRAKARILPGADDIDEMLHAVHEALSRRSRR